ncbi:MAG: hypothetical protein L6U99_10325 [Clostridium sp.]|nr:MAG: hypothetical protein L6U99_10325 [Clostridium sp.]
MLLVQFFQAIFKLDKTVSKGVEMLCGYIDFAIKNKETIAKELNNTPIVLDLVKRIELFRL